MKKQKTYKPLSRGNSKLDSSIAIFNLPPVKSCLNCASCKKSCYARGSYERWTNVRNAYDRNFDLAKNNPNILYDAIVSQLMKSRGIRAVRVHSSGDFFSQEYIDLWARVITFFPGLRFYAYTKVDKMLDFSKITKLKNFNLIPSLIDGKLNFGNEEYIHRLKLEYPKAYICPAIHNDAIHCGRQCNYCIRGNMPLFYQH